MALASKADKKAALEAMAEETWRAYWEEFGEEVGFMSRKLAANHAWMVANKLWIKVEMDLIDEAYESGDQAIKEAE